MGKAKTIKETGRSADKKVNGRKPYLTKRILVSAARQGFRKASEETMKVMGYNVIAKDGWVVKIFPDGSIEKISPLEIETDNDDVILD